MQVPRIIDELDRVALALPQALASARSPSLASRAQAIIDLCQALRLIILLDRPPSEALEVSSQILAAVRQMLTLSQSSRAHQRARMTVALARRCAEDVHRLLSLAPV